ncbi:hypothetical protein VOLCADRAFT_98166, partial [Volvox carteri f. nagariensis]
MRQEQSSVRRTMLFAQKLTWLTLKRCGQFQRLAQRMRTQLIVTARVAAKDPYAIVVPLLLLICMLALGLWGVFSVGNTIRDGRREAALNAATDFSNTLKSHIAATVAPASTVKTLVELNPDWPSINKTFHAVAPSLRAGMMGIVTRYAVFISGAGPDETFGFNGSAYNCTPCYQPPSQSGTGSSIDNNSAAVGKRFWGFAQLNVDWEMLIRNITRMYDLCERDNLSFNMTYIDPVSYINRSIAACGGNLGPDPVFVHIDTMANHWVLAVIATLRRGEEYAEAFQSVTVLFSDIVSYTTLASEMEPIKVVRLLNEMYSEYDALVDQFECYKVETIGD